MAKPYFGIRISTYRRKNGTFHLLARCLQSIIAQTFTDWKVFLIGDHYVPAKEFETLSKMIPNIYSENLSYSPERSILSGKELWKVAGFTASCLGLKKIQEECIICTCLDDDDYWMPNHLQVLYENYQKFPDAGFIYTQSTYKNGVLPKEKPELAYNNMPPKAYGLVHSAASWNVSKIPLMYSKEHKLVAGDAAMWEKIRSHCDKNGIKSLYIPELTVKHDSEEGKGIVEQPKL